MKFRFANTQALLTYKGHVGKENIHKFLDNLGVRNVIAIVVSHETGKDGDYDHTHVIVKWDAVFQTSNSRKFDYDGIHPNIKILPGKKGFKDGLKYLSKEDNDIYKWGDVPEEDVNMEDKVNDILAKDNLLDAIKEAKSWNEVIPIMQLWEKEAKRFQIMARQEKMMERLRNLKLRPCQIEMHKRLINQDNRKILWVVDTKGGCGKTTFLRWLRAKYGKHRTFRMTNKARDNGHMWNGEEFVMLNLVRTKEEYISYEAIEDMKDGWASSGKYGGKDEMYEHPKVIVVANFHPYLEALSMDRWDIYTVKE